MWSERIRSSFEKPRRKAGLLFALLAGAIVLLAVLPLLPSEQRFTLCLVKNVTGLPCPGCGMGRATSHLAHLRFTEALRLNALSYLLSLFVFAALIASLRDFLRGEIRWITALDRLPLKWLWVGLIVLAVAAQGGWNLWRHFHGGF